MPDRKVSGLHGQTFQRKSPFLLVSGEARSVFLFGTVMWILPNLLRGSPDGIGSLRRGVQFRRHRRLALMITIPHGLCGRGKRRVPGWRGTQHSAKRFRETNQFLVKMQAFRAVGMHAPKKQGGSARGRDDAWLGTEVRCLTNGKEVLLAGGQCDTQAS